MKNYHCPDFLYNRYFFEQIMELKQNYPHIFVDNMNIGSIFGIFPNMIWNGGGVDLGERWTFDSIEEVLGHYFDLNLKLRLTLTNPVLDKEDCLDKYCNNVLLIVSYFSNVEVLVSSPILENHIREHFPNITLNHSIIATKEEKNLEQYIEELSKYNTVVLPRRLVKNQDFLLSIPNEFRNRFELLCNDPCPIDCPRLYEHYRAFGEHQRGNIINLELLQCTNPNCQPPLRSFSSRQYQISLKEIEEFYEPANFSEFKISGRGGNVGTINMILMFFKPEYQVDMLTHFLG